VGARLRDTRSASGASGILGEESEAEVQLYIEGPNDKVFTFWTVNKFPDQGKIPNRKMNLAAFDYLRGESLAKLISAEQKATAAAMVEASRPNCTFTLDKVDEEHLGAFLQLMEFWGRSSPLA